MEARNFLLGVCPNLSVPLDRYGKGSRLIKSPQLPSPPYSSFIQFQKLASRGSCNCSCITYKVSCRKRIECSSNLERGVVTTEGNNSRAQVRRKSLAGFVSGGGSNFRSIHEASIQGSIHGNVSVLVTNKNNCGGAEYARDKGIPVILFPNDEVSTSELVNKLRSMEIDFILLAGYLKLIPKELIQAYKRSIINIHPSLLPAFGGQGYYGMKVHRAVIASGARYSGPTIHIVDEHYDTGRILAQRVVPVLPNDTAEELAARVLREEHRLYVEVVEALCEERIVWREDGVPLIRGKENPNDLS